MTEEIINFKPVTFREMLCNLSGKSNSSILKWDIMSCWIDGIICKYTTNTVQSKTSMENWFINYTVTNMSPLIQNKKIVFREQQEFSLERQRNS